MAKKPKTPRIRIKPSRKKTTKDEKIEASVRMWQSRVRRGIRLQTPWWGEGRTYHHTPPISMIYALFEALAIATEEGLPARYQRHAVNARALQAGLEALGLQLLVRPEYRLPGLTTVRVPEGIDDMKLRGALLNDYNIEIGGGQGPLAGKIWRIGHMGWGEPEHIDDCISALEKALASA